MRTISPPDEKAASADLRSVDTDYTDTIASVRVPFGLSIHRIIVNFRVYKEACDNKGGEELSTGIRAFITVVFWSVLLLTMMLSVMGLVFIIYMVKKYAGLDLFPGFHLF